MYSKLLYCLPVIVTALGIIALLNWIGGEKHLFFNKAREDWRKLKNSNGPEK